jgi:hypothetical protein
MADRGVRSSRQLSIEASRWLPGLPRYFDLRSERIPTGGNVEVGVFPVGMRALREARNLPGIGPTSSSPLLDGYALGVLARDVSSIDTGAFIAATAGPLVDVIGAINDRTNAEVLLVVTAADQQRVYYHSTETFSTCGHGLALLLAR